MARKVLEYPFVLQAAGQLPLFLLYCGRRGKLEQFSGCSLAEARGRAAQARGS